MKVLSSYILYFFSSELSEGNDYLRDLDFLEYNIWFNFLGLGLIATATMTLAYIFLVRIKKTSWVAIYLCDTFAF